MENNQKTTEEILKKRSKTKAGRFFLRILKLFLIFSLLSMGIILITGAGVYLYLSQDLPKINSLSDYRPPVITTVLSDEGQKIGEFFKEKRVVIPLSEMPEYLLSAFIAAEDDRFYQHKGIDFLSILRAFVKNLEAGSIVQGGSTITQQVTRSFFLSPEKSYKRKIKEAILAYRIDNYFTKDQILFLYLNQIYLGNGSYGVESAAQSYFGKSAKNLNLAECALLAGLPQAPSRYSPINNLKGAKNRQVYVLNRMVAEKYISNIEATEALNHKLIINPSKNEYFDKVPYYTEYIRQYVEKKYGSYVLYNEGLKIHTAVNIEMQGIAQKEIDKGLRELDKRRGYRGPERHLENDKIEEFLIAQQNKNYNWILRENDISIGVVSEINASDNEVIVRIGGNSGILKSEEFEWAKSGKKDRANKIFKVGDVIEVKILSKNYRQDMWKLSLEQNPQAQSALLSIEAETGHVKAMVGGKDFKESQYNRAVQSRRQPGSAFKPVVYSAAIDKGYTPATVIYDTAVVYEDKGTKSIWKPKNYNKQFYGPTRLREALTHSRNLVTIKILKDIGVDYTIEYARKLGIQSDLSRDLSLALGSSGVSLLEIVNAYSVFANMGYKIEPVFVTKIVDRDGNVLEQNGGQREKAIEKSTAYIVTSLLESVVKEGTGRKVLSLNRPVAGKTGTTNDFIDAWFVGYTPQLITGVWVGFDKEKSLGRNETGSKAAAPIWLEYMKGAMKGKPVRVFQPPEGIIFAKIDAETGLLAIPESQNTIFECFKAGTAPTRETKKPDMISDQEDFFKSGL